MTESRVTPAETPANFVFGDPTTTREARLWRGDGPGAKGISQGSVMNRTMNNGRSGMGAADCRVGECGAVVIAFGAAPPAP